MGEVSNIFSDRGIAYYDVAPSTGGDSLVTFHERSDQVTGVWFSAGGEERGRFVLDASDEGIAWPVEGVATLLDGSVLLRSSNGWEWQYGEGAETGAPAPGWLRGDARDLRWLPNGKGYALVPRADGCNRTLRVHAPSGRPCGEVTVSTLGDACEGALELGPEGTVLQQSGTETCAGGECTCTHRWSPGLMP